jgi:hypothetical protein
MTVRGKKVGESDEWTDEKQVAFEKAIKTWIEINGRIPSLEQESDIWESLAFPKKEIDNTAQ